MANVTTLAMAGNRTVNGKPVTKAEIIEENGIYSARLTDCWGREFLSGSNNRSYDAELLVLKEMMDPVDR